MNGKGYNKDLYIVYKLNNGSGKVKYYYESGDISFELEYLKGKINGKIKEYNRVGVVIFEGEYINGEKNGYGKEYNDSGILKFEGKYLNGKKWDGKGYDTSNNILYELKDGMGIIIENYNDFYEYIDGEVNGNAKFSYNTNCQSFEGKKKKKKKMEKEKTIYLKN